MIKIVSLAAALLAASAVPAFACTQIFSKTVELTGCVADEFEQTAGEGAQEFVYATADQNFGFMVITEKDAFTQKQFHDAILANAVSGAGGNAADVKTVSERSEIIDGKTFNVLEYELANQGNPILFQNFYYSANGFGSVQVLSYSLTTASTAAAYKAGVFLSTVKLGGLNKNAPAATAIPTAPSAPATDTSSLEPSDASSAAPN